LRAFDARFSIFYPTKKFAMEPHGSTANGGSSDRFRDSLLTCFMSRVPREFLAMLIIDRVYALPRRRRCGSGVVDGNLLKNVLFCMQENPGVLVELVEKFDANQISIADVDAFLDLMWAFKN